VQGLERGFGARTDVDLVLELDEELDTLEEESSDLILLMGV
jgi:hypothetical protein